MTRTKQKLNENWHFHEGDIEFTPLTDKNSAAENPPRSCLVIILL